MVDSSLNLMMTVGSSVDFLLLQLVFPLCPSWHYLFPLLMPLCTKITLLCSLECTCHPSCILQQPLSWPLSPSTRPMMIMMLLVMVSPNPLFSMISSWSVFSLPSPLNYSLSLVPSFWVTKQWKRGPARNTDCRIPWPVCSTRTIQSLKHSEY